MSDYPRDGVCECGALAKIVITSSPLFTIAHSWFQPGPDVGAGQTFRTFDERKEWMARNNMHEIMPEQSDRWLKYRADCQQAKADGAPEPKAPDPFKHPKITFDRDKVEYMRQQEKQIRESIRYAD